MEFLLDKLKATSNNADSFNSQRRNKTKSVSRVM